MTWNIHGGRGTDGRRSLERIAGLIREAEPDVVCLQEVHRRMPQSRFEDQPARLARLLEMPVIFRPSYRVGLAEYGNAVATRLPLRWVNLVRLPNAAERRQRRGMFLERRAMLAVDLDAPAGPLRVLCTHWSLAAEDQLASARLMALRLQGAHVQCVVAGDLNCGLYSPEAQPLLESGRIADVCRGIRTLTFPAERPTACIDHVLGPAAASAMCRTVETTASDHRPVLVEWQL